VWRAPTRRPQQLACPLHIADLSVLWISRTVDDRVHTTERFRQASILREITHDKLGASRERDLRAATEGARCISTGE
jgi:hypothetical protein